MGALSIFGRIIFYAINIFLLILTIRVFLSWLVLPPSRPIFYLYKITDPVLSFAKKYFPLRFGIIDLSIIFPFIILNILNKIVLDILVNGRPLTPFYLIALSLFFIDSIINVVAFALVIFCVIMIVVHFVARYSYNPLITAVKSIISPITMRLRRIIKINGKYADIIYLVVIIFVAIISATLLRYLIGILINLCSAS